MKLMSKERITIPNISVIQKLLITVEIIFIMFRLSQFLTQMIESNSPEKTEKIFTPDQMERISSVNVILNNAGTNITNGIRLIISAITPNF